MKLLVQFIQRNILNRLQNVIRISRLAAVRIIRIVRESISKEKHFDYYFSSANPRDIGYHKSIFTLTDGNDLIKQKLSLSEPVLISRFGTGELACVVNYLLNQKQKKAQWHKQVIYMMEAFGGLFPMSDKTLSFFSEEYLQAAGCIDILGIWYNKGENEIARQFCNKADLVPLRSLEPYYHKFPWSANLSQQKVLVIHPFSESIQSQYRRRELLFNDLQVLPSFDLITYKAYQTFSGNSCFKSWGDVLDKMKSDIQNIDFTIAIIGAGPYGLPLAAFCKKMNKKVLHLGGATQILFGIKGNRWDEHDFISKLYNSSWVRPMLNETPVHAERIEGACYW